MHIYCSQPPLLLLVIRRALNVNTRFSLADRSGRCGPAIARRITRAIHPASSIQHPAFSIQHLESTIYHLPSTIYHLARQVSVHIVPCIQPRLQASTTVTLYPHLFPRRHHATPGTPKRQERGKSEARWTAGNSSRSSTRTSSSTRDTPSPRNSDRALTALFGTPFDTARLCICVCFCICMRRLPGHARKPRGLPLDQRRRQQ